MENMIRTWNANVKTENQSINGLGLVWFDGSAGTMHQIGKNTWEALSKDAEILHHRDDVICCFNHQFDKVLGREKNDTLSISIGAAGLSYTVQLNEKDPEHQSIKAKIDRKDVEGSSASFQPVMSKWDGDVLLYTKIMLIEVGPVSIPAMTSSTAFSLSDSDYARRALETRKRITVFDIGKKK